MAEGAGHLHSVPANVGLGHAQWDTPCVRWCVGHLRTEAWLQLNGSVTEAQSVKSLGIPPLTEMSVLSAKDCKSTMPHPPLTAGRRDSWMCRISCSRLVFLTVAFASNTTLPRLGSAGALDVGPCGHPTPDGSEGQMFLPIDWKNKGP